MLQIDSEMTIQVFQWQIYNLRGYYAYLSKGGTHEVNTYQQQANVPVKFWLIGSTQRPAGETSEIIYNIIHCLLNYFTVLQIL